MPSLAESSKFNHTKVVKQLVRLPRSRFYKSDYTQLVKRLAPSHARRHLFLLQMANDTEKSAFSDISEKSRGEESNSSSKLSAPFLREQIRPDDVTAGEQNESPSNFAQQPRSSQEVTAGASISPWYSDEECLRREMSWTETELSRRIR